jgi:hypothetical protein
MTSVRAARRGGRLAITKTMRAVTLVIETVVCVDTGRSSPMDCYPNPDAGLPGRYPILCALGRIIFVVGDYGKIVRSENRGVTWSQQSNLVWDYKPELQQTLNSLTLNSVFVRASRLRLGPPGRFTHASWAPGSTLAASRSLGCVLLVSATCVKKVHLARLRRGVRGGGESTPP